MPTPSSGEAGRAASVAARIEECGKAAARRNWTKEIRRAGCAFVRLAEEPSASAYSLSVRLQPSHAPYPTRPVLCHPYAVAASGETTDSRVYRWIDHTAELELAIEAPTDAGVFADALPALGQLLGEEAAAVACGLREGQPTSRGPTATRWLTRCAAPLPASSPRPSPRRLGRSTTSPTTSPRSRSTEPILP